MDDNDNDMTCSSVPTWVPTVLNVNGVGVMALWHYVINSPLFFGLSDYVGFVRVISPDSNSNVHNFSLIWIKMKLTHREA